MFVESSVVWKRKSILFRLGIPFSIEMGWRSVGWNRLETLRLWHQPSGQRLDADERRGGSEDNVADRKGCASHKKNVFLFLASFLGMVLVLQSRSAHFGGV